MSLLRRFLCASHHVRQLFRVDGKWASTGPCHRPEVAPSTSCFAEGCGAPCRCKAGPRPGERYRCSRSSRHGVSEGEFRVLEDGVEQTITSFAREEAPVSLGLLFESSGSMKTRLDGSIAALKYFFQTVMPGDGVRRSIRRSGSPHRRIYVRPNEIDRRLGFVEAKGWTALLDAVAMGTHQVKSAKNRRRVLLVLSDGNDNNSRFTESEIKNMVIEGRPRACLRHWPELPSAASPAVGGGDRRKSGGEHGGAAGCGTAPQRGDSQSVPDRLHVGNAPNDGKYHRKVKLKWSRRRLAGASDVLAARLLRPGE